MGKVKTFKQLADELGVSKDKVKYQAKKLPPDCIVKEGGVAYLTEQGEAEIRRLLGEAPAQIEEHPAVTDPMAAVLKITIDTLQEQLAEKDALIRRLQDELEKERQHGRDQADKLAVLADQAQRLHAGSVQKQLGDGSRKWWQFWKGE